MRLLFGIAIIVFFCLSLDGQVEKRLLRKGNVHYKANDYEKAAELYGKSFDTLSTYNPAQFNLGNASYRMNKLDDAVYAYEMQANKLDDRTKKSTAFHNLGNTYMQKFSEVSQLAQHASPDTAQMLAQGAFQFLQKSVDAYKNSLRNNPTDDETRHNLALAKKLMEQFQQQNQDQSGGQNNQDQNQDEQEKQDQQDQDQEQQNRDQQGENKEDQSKEEQQNQSEGDKKEKENQEGKEQQAQPQQISKEDAEKMLEALKNQEQKLHEKMKKRKKPAKVIVIEKDW